MSIQSTAKFGKKLMKNSREGQKSIHYRDDTVIITTSDPSGGGCYNCSSTSQNSRVCCPD
ncbi:hypothetical protein [Acinetobacter sp. WZC-1]|uniref:hypothetical protein n=1 Tax=Acinetobacter sp. WZC-1 TaxID=3459034 RepID=UPI00403E2A05